MRNGRRNSSDRGQAVPNGRGKRGNGGEFDIIARYFAPLATNPAALGLLDDAAVLSIPEGQELVATCDTITGGVHFLTNDPPDTIAYKAVAVSLSDLAAKGARPHVYLLSVAFPERLLAALARGLRHGPTGGARGIRHRACRRRHLQHPRAAHHHGHRHRHAAARRGGVAPGRHGRRPPLRQRHHRRRRARAEAVASASGSRRNGVYRQTRALFSSIAIVAPLRAMHLPCRCVNAPARRSMSPTGSSAIR